MLQFYDLYDEKIKCVQHNARSVIHVSSSLKLHNAMKFSKEPSSHLVLNQEALYKDPTEVWISLFGYNFRSLPYSALHVEGRWASWAVMVLLCQ